MKSPRPWADRQSIQETEYSQSFSDAADRAKNSSRLVYGMVWDSSQGPGTRRSCSSACTITPVSPMPPTVAANQSAFSLGLQVSSVPSVRTRVKDSR